MTVACVPCVWTQSRRNSSRDGLRPAWETRWIRSLPAGIVQRQIVLQAAPSSGQPRPISSLGRAGRPHRPWFPHGLRPASANASKVPAPCGPRRMPAASTARMMVAGLFTLPLASGTAKHSIASHAAAWAPRTARCCAGSYCTSGGGGGGALLETWPGVVAWLTSGECQRKAIRFAVEM